MAECYVPYVQGLMQNYYRAGGSHWKQPLRGRVKVVYILPSSDLTLALLLVGYTEYDDDDDPIKQIITPDKKKIKLPKKRHTDLKFCMDMNPLLFGPSDMN
ncbi:hypothetical protein Hanom_Chr01g00035061 [Helianthus anomalus]